VWTLTGMGYTRAFEVAPLKVACNGRVAVACFMLFLTAAACDDRDITLTGVIAGGGASGMPSMMDAGVTLPALPAGDPPLADAGTIDPLATSDASVDPVVITTPEPVTPDETPDPDPPMDPHGPLAIDCSVLPDPPVDYDTLEGFTSSEDFVFDAQGNYVGVDEDGNLVRISKTGEKELWAPSIGSTAGMAILPDGSIVFCEIQEGAIKRAYPNGAVVVVLGGLQYPNGLDIGPDGFIYVAENGAGRVRRVNPDTGEFSIIAHGLTGPNGVAFSDDPQLLYVGSFEGSGVYKIVLDDPEGVGQPSVLAGESTLPEPELVCADLEEGADCSTMYVSEGRCEVIANVVDCLPQDPCLELEDGAACSFLYIYGACSEGRCVAVPPPCEGLREGDACEDPSFGVGVCYDAGSELYCSMPNPCDGLEAGAACNDPFSGAGACIELGEGYMYCEPRNVCDGLERGDACQDAFTVGICQGGDTLYCYPSNVCTGRAVGTPCEDEFVRAGVCDEYDGYRYCTQPNECDGRREGDPCEGPFEGPGFCLPIEPFLPTLDEDAGAPVPPPSAVDAGTPPDAGAEATDDDLYCQLPSSCVGLPDRTPCSGPAGSGSCERERCVVRDLAGGIDGLGVDACGNVYASEYVTGNVWRISPAGDLERLVNLPSGWIPNIKWGRDIGGFSSDVMYVADRDMGRLFGLHVGVRGAQEFFEKGP
jgi:sugar lactone lactonase YvrE